jgi:Secretion system C-terminal sorting domain
MKKNILFFIFIITLQKNLHAQQVFLQTPCAGTGQGTAGNFIISYTIGEMPLVQTFKNSGLLLTNGIIQPELGKADTDGTGFAAGEIIIFPNPTPGNLFIQYNLLTAGKLNIQLYNALGQQLLTDEISVNSFSTKKYNFSKYANAVYLLKIQFAGSNNSVVKKGTYKITKM